MGNAAYRRAHYQRNKDAYKSKAKAWTKATILSNREKIDLYLTARPCVDCGEPDIVVLEFDHVRGKKRNDVSVMVNRGCTWKTIASEIDKCEVRCANCHRRRTARSRSAAESASVS